MSAAIWPTRWFTANSGFSSDTASALAAPMPTMSAPASPGPDVTATASMSASPTPASASAAWIAGSQRLEVRAGGDLGHDAAVAGVLVHRAGDRVRKQRAPAHDADAGLVAAGLDAEHERFDGVHVHAPASVADAATAGRAAHPWVLELHHDGVDVVGLVVPRAASHLDESLGGVERLRDRVVGAHLEEDLVHPAGRGLAEECVQQRAAPPPAPGARGDRDRLDVGILRPSRRAKPRIADEAPRLFVHDVPAVGGRELLGHHRLGPRVGRERGALERHDRVEILGGRLPHSHAVTRFGPAGSVTSGERR